MGRKSIVLLVSLLVAFVPFCGCASREPATFRVMTYNIRHGEGLDGKIDLERIARVIRRSDADLIALEEVDRGVKRSDGVDQPARLAALTGMQAVFEKNADVQGGDYGNAVLSRLPVEHCENHLLPRMPGNEQRGLLEVHLRVGGRPLTFFATHFDHQKDDAERLASVAALRELLATTEGPVIVAGDLNATPDSPTLEQLHAFLDDAAAEAGSDALTFPADAPDRRIDYILYRPDSGLRVTAYKVIPDAVASDHRPVTATLYLCGLGQIGKLEAVSSGDRQPAAAQQRSGDQKTGQPITQISKTK